MTESVSHEKPRIVILTGYSGAGKSIAIKALEDLSFYCVDNLPVGLMEHTVRYILEHFPDRRNIAFGLDSRSDRFVDEFFAIKKSLEQFAIVDVLFLVCDRNVLVRRFSTTRRKHPLLDSGGELVAAINREKAVLAKIRAGADRVLDTSFWNTRNVIDAMETTFGQDIKERSLNISLVSFGFKHGYLSPADNIIDVRFLKNPYYQPRLKELTGETPEIKDYVLEDSLTQKFLGQLKEFYQFMLPAYHQEGKHYLRIGIGCTGGKHRSVVITEEMSAFIQHKSKTGSRFNVSVVHRDIERP